MPGPLDCKVYVGNLGSQGSKSELEREFEYYGPLTNVWVARNPPGFAFVEFVNERDARDAVRALDGRTICGVRARVELSSGMSRKGSRGGGGGGGRFGGGGGGRYGSSNHGWDDYSDRRRSYRSRSRSPRRRYSRSRSGSRDRSYKKNRRSPSRSPKRSPPPRHSRSRSVTPDDRRQKSRSGSPAQRRSPSRSRSRSSD